ncbi:hypothetical protein SAMN05192529_10929 [Arachidicoccus rhizosphaerae]|uniref:Uncharacterized protein n=1 Tax=Arachidicoccus rhizosphaerae TaxID=551991 RepID=A0A1H3YU80_9BACT|nr:hypothetical protein [Arachidicoccus rhizosphaerae]SEA14574.1 hypothetical protein SAMN05192529_10929 [Arachidicoccus rhizosphaerae]
MVEIKINRNISPRKLSDLRKLYFGQSDLGDIVLILPSEISRYSFGLLADLLSFVITINNKYSIKKLKLNILRDDLIALYDQEYFYPIISLLWNTASFVDKQDTDIKSLLREEQNSFFKKMNSLSRMKGNKFFLTMVDHLPGYVRLLENSNGFNDDEDQISNIFELILKKYILTFNKNNLSEIAGIKNDIGAIVYELAKNTDEWGKTDKENINFSSSIRGVYLRFHVNSHEKLVEEYASTPLLAFFNSSEIINSCLNELGQLYYLEILIYDSGIGFIDKFHSAPNFKDIDVIKRCLVKNQTTSTSNLKSKKGIGLDRILNILNKKGFLRILTDKYCVYRDLIKCEYKPIDIEKLDDLILEDWNGLNFDSMDSPKLQGSFISILYPFKKSN